MISFTGPKLCAQNTPCTRTKFPLKPIHHYQSSIETDQVAVEVNRYAKHLSCVFKWKKGEIEVLKIPIKVEVLLQFVFSENNT